MTDHLKPTQAENARQTERASAKAAHLTEALYEDNEVFWSDLLDNPRSSHRRASIL